MPTICGTNPHTGKNGVIYAINIPRADVAEVIERGKAEGWTNLTTIQTESRLLGESESSESPSSTTENGSSSGTSGAASHASATRSSTSRRKARPKRS